MRDKPRGGMRQKSKKSYEDEPKKDKKLPRRGERTAKNRGSY